MINRRLLRIKAVQVLYSYYKSAEKKSVQAAENELMHSVDKSFELYHLFLLLPIEVTRLEQQKIDRNKAKHITSEHDLNPNTNFVSNKLVALLSDNEALNTFREDSGISWKNHPELIKQLYEIVLATPAYEEYMAIENPTFEEDKQFWIRIFRKNLPEFEELGNVLEEISIYWNDDSDLILNMAQKTIKNLDIEKGAKNALMPQYKDIEDRDFVVKLVHQTILKGKEYQDEIEAATKHWDMERIAFMDSLVMKAALAEMVAFPGIPIKVTLNEYIDIAKSYSTKKSGLFINGVLDNVVVKLKKEGKIKKVGRGLIE